MTPELKERQEQQLGIIEGMRDAIKAVRNRLPKINKASGGKGSEPLEEMAIYAMQTVMKAMEEALGQARLDLHRFGPLPDPDNAEEWFDSHIIQALKSTPVLGSPPNG